MPELPEVETTRRGISPHVERQRVDHVIVRDHRLRWPVSENLAGILKGQQILSIVRRAKYLLFRCETGHLLIHLGMSGSLRIVEAGSPAGKHDHVDVALSSGRSLRFTDPRRFGAVLWLDGEPEAHPLLCHLGPEPLDGEFDGAYLYRRSRQRRTAVKTFLMDNRIVVGVGNIYANEVLFLSGIRPDRAAGNISRKRYDRLAENVISVLQRAIEQGGTTLRDFVGGDGKPGYFRQQLNVYGRAGEPCTHCGNQLKEIRLGQRSTVFCHRCQR